MEQWPLRAIAFVLGPLGTKRAAELGRRKLGGAQPTRQLKTPGGATLEQTTAEEARAAHAAVGETDGLPAWLLAAAGAGALAITGLVVYDSGSRGKRAEAAAPRETQAHRFSRGADFGGA
jgi:hypothetical protein